MATTLDENATCMGCGYRLANLPTKRCPECGRWFDPSDSSTYRNTWHLMNWRRWANAPSLTECWIVIVLSVYGVLEASGPAQWEAAQLCIVGFVGVPAWFWIGIVYFNRILASRRDRQRAAHDLDTSERRPRWRWLVLPICTALVISTFVYPWPLMLRFRLSQSAFDAAVKNYQAGRRVIGGGWIGLYHVDRVHEITYVGGRPPSIGFVTGSSIGDPVGFAFDPLPGHPSGYKVVRVGPSWYTYED